MSRARCSPDAAPRDVPEQTDRADHHAWSSAVSCGQAAAPFITVHLRAGDLELQLFTMLTSIGTPLDVTAEEIHIETYVPADDASETILRSLSATS